MIVVYSLGALLAVFLLTVLVGAPYLPSLAVDLKQLFEQLELKKDDVVVDAGSGDGRLLRLVSPRVKRAVGYEINPVLILISKLLSRKYQNVKVQLADFRSVDLPPDTTVVYIFSASMHLNHFLQPIWRFLEQNNKPLLVVSYGFSLNQINIKPKSIGPFWVYRFDKGSLPNRSRLV